MVWSKGNPGIGRGEGGTGPEGALTTQKAGGESSRKDLIRWLWSLEWRKNGGEGLEVRMKKELSEAGTVWIEEEKERARGRASTERLIQGKSKKGREPTPIWGCIGGLATPQTLASSIGTLVAGACPVIQDYYGRLQPGRGGQVRRELGIVHEQRTRSWSIISRERMPSVRID